MTPDPTLHGLSFDAHLSTLFTERPLLERPRVAREAGFDAVECWWPFDAVAVPSDAAVDAFVSAITDAGVRLVSLNFFAGDMAAGDSGLVSWPGRQEELAESVEVALDIADRLGTRRFNALYGNRLDGVDPEEQDEVAAATLDTLARRVGEFDGKLVLEALSGRPAYPLTTTADALAVLDRVGRPELTLLTDLYHRAVVGDIDTVAEQAGRTGHVQLADAPGRREPGSGTTDLDRHLAALEAAGYDGFVGLEYLPSTDTLGSLDWLPRERRGIR
ncbi:hydroxypyruvate isomerase [Prauserella isguenensis]|uniref:Hydroxypyruvate isomerase n=1 Tax=Prauserella isguenensis TaxID=1470180 RepID=A0A839S472_9PSEU|nr:TIM barrel protein [Prauserella isguenensis]MBB3052154.1 hydroxypyruvate isomerase [Prauserella isguenensis]